MDKAQIREKWQKFSPSYSSYAEHLTLAAGRSLATSAGFQLLPESARILELACGSGRLAQELFATGCVPKGAYYLATDYTLAMVERARVRLAALPIDVQVQDAMDLADVATGSMDRVICNLGVQVVPSSWKAIAEARRVLKVGGQLVFSTWGNPEESLMLTTLPLARRNILNDDTPVSPMFQLGSDPSALRAKLRDEGFDSVVTWIVPVVEPSTSGREFTKQMADSLDAAFNEASQGKKEEVIAEMERIVDERLAQGRTVGLETLCVRAIKK